MNRTTQAFLFLPLPANLVYLSPSGATRCGEFQISPRYETNLRLIFINLDSKVGAVIRFLPEISFFANSNMVVFSSSFEYDVYRGAQQINQFFGVARKLVSLLSFGSYKVIQFVGFRYRQRWFRQSQVLRYRFGYNSRVWFKCPLDFVSIIRKVSPKKRTHFFFSFDEFSVRRLTLLIHKYRPATIYKGRGVNFKEQPMVLKDGKKALW